MLISTCPGFSGFSMMSNCGRRFSSQIWSTFVVQRKRMQQRVPDGLIQNLARPLGVLRVRKHVALSEALDASPDGADLVRARPELRQEVDARHVTIVDANRRYSPRDIATSMTESSFVRSPIRQN